MDSLGASSRPIAAIITPATVPVTNRDDNMHKDNPDAITAAGMTTHGDGPEENPVPSSATQRPRDPATGRFLPLPEAPMPTVERVIVDGAWCARIGLSGIHAGGRTVLMDLDVWAEIAGIEPRWAVHRNSDGSEFIGSRTTSAGWLIGKGPDDDGITVLARLIMRASPRQRVRYLRGSFDLRRRSLALELDPRAIPAPTWRGRKIRRKAIPKRLSAAAVLVAAGAEVAR